jgi:putative membrane protein
MTIDPVGDDSLKTVMRTVFALICSKTTIAASIIGAVFLTPRRVRRSDKMLMNGSRSRLTAFVLATMAILACSRKENYADTTAASSTVTGDTSAMATGAPAGNWTDANIFAFLDEANMADSSAGSVAATKGTASTVRDFGRRMIRDHHQLRTQGAALAKKLNITPAAASDDQTISDAQKNLDNLNSTAKGKDFDKAYIDSEVDAHKKVLERATSAANQTQNAELKNLIQKAAPVIQGHLDLAESIQKNLK